MFNDCIDMERSQSMTKSKSSSISQITKNDVVFDQCYCYIYKLFEKIILNRIIDIY